MALPCHRGPLPGGPVGRVNRVDYRDLAAEFAEGGADRGGRLSGGGIGSAKKPWRHDGGGGFCLCRDAG